GDRLAVCDPRRGGGRLDAVLALELLQRDLEVDVAEAGDDQLVGFLDPLHVQGRVFLAQPGQARGDLFLVAARLGRDGDAVGRARQVEPRQRGRVLRPQRVPGQGVREL